MVGVDRTLGQVIGAYTNFILEDKTFLIFAIATLVFVIMIALNIEKNNAAFLFLGLNIVLIGIIVINFGADIIKNCDTFLSADLYKNMYFFFFNSIVALGISSTVYKSKRCEKGIKNLMLIIYYPLITNLIYMISISNYFQDAELITLFNAYPMVYVGNIIYFVLYGILFLYWLFLMKKKKKHRLGNHL